jgi:hypothetical protein
MKFLNLIIAMSSLFILVSCGEGNVISNAKNSECRSGYVKKDSPVLAVCTKDNALTYNDSQASCNGSCCNLVNQIKKSCKSINAKMARLSLLESAGRSNLVRFKDSCASCGVNSSFYVNDLYIKELIQKANQDEAFDNFAKNEYSTNDFASFFQ